MAERRQAHRREPIEVEVRERVVEARPLPWLDRNDLGNEVMRQYSELFNSTLTAIKNEDPDAAPQLELYLNDKIVDPARIIQMGYPDIDNDFLRTLEPDEMLELIYAALDVNQLESLRGLVDPNSSTPTTPGGNESGTPDQTDSQNQRSSPDSEFSDSTGTAS